MIGQHEWFLGEHCIPKRLMFSKKFDYSLSPIFQEHIIRGRHILFNPLSGDLCKSGPGYFASEKRFSLKLCLINYLWLQVNKTTLVFGNTLK